MRAFVYFTVFVSMGIVSCSKGKSPSSGSVEGEAPESLNRLRADVAGGQVVSVFKHGTLRKEFDLAEFSISKNPITVKQFQTCVHDGPCTEPTASCSDSNAHEQDAALCVGVENARVYCAWSGGRLATLNEWLMAARGRSPQRFSWGDGAPTCEQHPLARVPPADRTAAARRPEFEEHMTQCGESLDLLHRVGTHSAGASPSGLEDVLLISGELLRGQQDSNFGVCRGKEKTCVVYGLIPGAIDSVKRPSETEQEQPYAFRCVWSEEDA